MSGSQHRITIQLDLSGYSFTIYDRNGAQTAQESHPCPVDLSVKELAQVLGKQFSVVSVYFTTWKYTLVPVSHYSKESPGMYLRSVRDIQPGDRILTLDMPSRKAVMVFAVPESIYSGLTALNKNVRFYPTALTVFHPLPTITVFWYLSPRGCCILPRLRGTVCFSPTVSRPGIWPRRSTSYSP